MCRSCVNFRSSLCNWYQIINHRQFHRHVGRWPPFRISFLTYQQQFLNHLVPCTQRLLVRCRQTNGGYQRLWGRLLPPFTLIVHLSSNSAINVSILQNYVGNLIFRKIPTLILIHLFKPHWTLPNKPETRWSKDRCFVVAGNAEQVFSYSTGSVKHGSCSLPKYWKVVKRSLQWEG